MRGRKLFKLGGRIALGLIGMVAVGCATTSTPEGVDSTLPPDDFWFEGDGYKEAVEAELAAIDGTGEAPTAPDTTEYRNSPPPLPTPSNSPLPSRPVVSVSSAPPTPPTPPTPSVSSTPKPKPTPAPAPAPRPTPTVATKTHTVQKGDSLWSISRRYGSTVRAIAAANGLSSDTIRIGAVLKIPSGGGSSTSSSKPTVSAPARTHTVVKGDTLWSLSQKYGGTVDGIKKRNSLSGDALSIGQKLSIP